MIAGMLQMMSPVDYVMQVMQDCITAASGLEHQSHRARHGMQQGMFIINIAMLLAMITEIKIILWTFSVNINKNNNNK